MPCALQAPVDCVWFNFIPCEMSSVLKATIENKTTTVTTYLKKLTTGNKVFIVSVIV